MTSQREPIETLSVSPIFSPCVRGLLGTIANNSSGEPIELDRGANVSMVKRRLPELSKISLHFSPTRVPRKLILTSHLIRLFAAAAAAAAVA